VSKVAPLNVDGTSSRSSPANLLWWSSTSDRLLYSTVTQMMLLNSNDVIFKKFDSILTKVEEESIVTRLALEELKEEMRNRYEETKQ